MAGRLHLVVARVADDRLAVLFVEEVLANDTEVAFLAECLHGFQHLLLCLEAALVHQQDEVVYVWRHRDHVVHLV